MLCQLLHQMPLASSPAFICHTSVAHCQGKLLTAHALRSTGLSTPHTRQLDGAARALREAGGATAKDALNRLAANLLAGREAFVGLDTLDMKAAMIRVNCEQCSNYPCPNWSNPGKMCKACIRSEGYYQLAIAFRLRESKQPKPQSPSEGCPNKSAPGVYAGTCRKNRNMNTVYLCFCDQPTWDNQCEFCCPQNTGGYVQDGTGKCCPDGVQNCGPPRWGR